MKPALSAQGVGRWPLWILLLAGAGGLALFGDKTPPGTARAPAAPGAAASAAARAAPPRPAVPALEAIQPVLARADLAASAQPPSADLFATPAWRVPAPPPPAKAAPVVGPPGPPPAPVAPPLPYRLIGKKLEGEAWEVFLGRDDQSFILHAGDNLESAWRVERIEPPLLTLRHLASGQNQTLDIGAP